MSIFPASRQRTVTQAERQALADFLLSVGPNEPTLCEGWSTLDLTVHLVLRERRPDAAAGMFISAAAGHLDKVSESYRQRPFEELVQEFRSGPPVWNPMRLADRFVNTAENFVHHEDARRGRGEGDPRELDTATLDALWSVIAQSGRFFLRNSPVQVRLVREDCGATPPRSDDYSVTGGDTRGGSVTVTGDAGELLLWLYGREEAAFVSVEESEAGVAQRIVKQAI